MMPWTTTPAVLRWSQDTRGRGASLPPALFAPQAIHGSVRQHRSCWPLTSRPQKVVQEQPCWVWRSRGIHDPAKTSSTKTEKKGLMEELKSELSILPSSVFFLHPLPPVRGRSCCCPSHLHFSSWVWKLGKEMWRRVCVCVYVWLQG